MPKVRRSISLDGDGYVEKTTLYLDDDIKCTYYPSTRNMLIENELTGECVTLNYSCWQKVFAWFNSISKRKADS
jgi:hypothetical protein